MARLASRVRRARAHVTRTFAELRRGGSLPGFLVIGAQRSGTTSFLLHLRRHPAVAPPSRKEVHFFDRGSYLRGERHYRSFFPSTNRMARRGETITGEASPAYIFHPAAPARIAEMLPAAKFILLLRDPVERARSQHALQTRRGFETLTFEDAIGAEPDRLAGHEARLLADPAYTSTDYFRYSYLARGDYATQLERWLGYIDRDRLLVIVSEECFADPKPSMVRVEKFLGLPPHFDDVRLPRMHATSSPEMTSTTRAVLREHFAPMITRTGEILGRELAIDLHVIEAATDQGDDRVGVDATGGDHPGPGRDQTSDELRLRRDRHVRMRVEYQAEDGRARSAAARR